MSTLTSSQTGESDILRRIVDEDSSTLSADAAEALLRLRFGEADRRRMNQLAEQNRQGKIDAHGSEELQN